MTFPSLHMLDTNIASVIIKGNVPFILARLTALSMNSVVVSSVTEAELLYGLAKCGRPAGLAARIASFWRGLTCCLGIGKRLPLMAIYAPRWKPSGSVLRFRHDDRGACCVCRCHARDKGSSF